MIALLTAATLLLSSVLLGYYGRRHARAKRASNALFAILFVVYSAGAVLWLILGLLPALVPVVPPLQQRLHDLAGGDRSPRLQAFNHESFVEQEIILQSGGTIRLRLDNYDQNTAHNVSIYQDAFFKDPLFVGDAIDGPPLANFEAKTITYTFEAPATGRYYFRCDLHPQMNGVVSVVPYSNQGLLATMARRVYVASLQPDAGGEFVKARLQFPKQMALEYATSGLNIVLGVFLVRLRPFDWTARLLGLGMVGTAAVFNVQAHTGWVVAPELGVSLHDNFHLISGFAYVYALLVFPDGKLRLHWPRLRWFGWPLRLTFLAFATYVGVNVGWLLHGGDPAGYLIFFGIVIPLTGIVAQFARARYAASATERQQSRVLMWALMLALSITAVFGLLTLLHGLLGGPAAESDARELRGLAFALFPPLFAVIPLTLFVTLLRYRLWDIDRVINRTLVYGTLTLILGASYGGLVLLMQQLVGRLQGSELVIVVSTLIVAWLFRPLRSRVQGVVDRRFNRQRYDAVRTVDAFSARLRHQIDLDTLTYELRCVVQETMEPHTVSVWLRASAAGAPSPTAAFPGRQRLRSQGSTGRLSATAVPLDADESLSTSRESRFGRWQA